MATYSNGYDYRRLITVPAESVAGSTDFTNFPFLFRQIDPLYKNVANGGQVHLNTGIDIRFETETGTKLDFFMERYNNVTGELISWIRIPTLKATDVTRIYMYWGKDMTGTEENEAGIWSSSIYKGVWHMWQDAGGGAPQFTDASGNGNHGTGTGLTSASTVEGKIGRGLQLTGANYVTVPDSASLHTTGDLTVSFWMKPSGTRQPGTRRENPVHKAYGGEYGFTYEIDGNLSAFYGSAGADNTPYLGLTADARIRDNNWHHIQITRGASWFSVYVDGALQGRIANTQSVVASTNPLYFGKGYVNGFTGYLDEIRWQATERSADWIATEYRNQNAPSNFFYVGEPDTYANGYSYRRLVTVSSTMVSGGAALSDFFLLVTGTITDLKSVSNGGKLQVANSLVDVRFEMLNGDKLFHEMDYMDPTTGQFFAWVRIPSLSNSANTQIYMYYGKALTETEENPYGVFDARKLYMAHHMNGVPDSNAGSIEQIDSSVMQQNASGRGSMTSGQRVAGKIGYGLNFDGVNDTLDVTDVTGEAANGFYHPSQDMTISAWINTANSGKSFQSIMEFRSSVSPVGGFRLDNVSGVQKVNLVKYGIIDQYVNTGTIASNTWHHLVVVQGATSATYYLDGASLGSFANSSAFGTAMVPLDIGGSGDTHGNTNYFQGILDEVRFYKSQLSAAYITTEYRNQANPGTYLTFSSEETPVIAVDATASQLLDSVVLTEHKTLAINELLHAHTLDNIAITQAHTIVVVDMAHTQTLDGVGVFAQNSLLVVPDLLHGHALDSSVLIDGGIPVPADALQGQSLDNVVLTQRHLLQVADMAHAHTLDNVLITQAHQLSGIADLLHSQAIEPVTLTQAHFLALQDVLHTQTIDNVLLFQRHVLAVQDALQGHMLDNPYVYTMIPVIVQDMAQGQLLDATIIQVYRKRKPNSVLPSRDIPRIMIIDNTPRIEVRPGVRTSPRVAGMGGIKPSIVEQKSLPRLKDFPK